MRNLMATSVATSAPAMPDAAVRYGRFNRQLSAAWRVLCCDLFRAIKEHPDSITSIAKRLHRDRSAVKRDVDQLAGAGLVLIEQQIHPGHGQMKQVRVAATEFRLEAQLA